MFYAAPCWLPFSAFLSREWLDPVLSSWWGQDWDRGGEGKVQEAGDPVRRGEERMTEVGRAYVVRPFCFLPLQLLHSNQTLNFLPQGPIWHMEIQNNAFNVSDFWFCIFKVNCYYCVTVFQNTTSLLPTFCQLFSPSFPLPSFTPSFLSLALFAFSWSKLLWFPLCWEFFLF